MKRVRGEPYIGTSQVERHRYPVKVNIDMCSKLVNEEERFALYTAFRGMESSDNQWYFIASQIEQKWNELEGKRGAVEIATCMYDYMMSQQNIEEVRIISDGCGGQQKNVIFVSMCVTLCQTHPGLRTIDHKFFESGHTEMECDSMHSKIEKKSKNVPVYVPEGWAQII
ncbi:hypothetical protein PR048_032731 [Dryococelus australis]|uniref:Uncharacterized protein n=1 Tax=Dryococelus australis TaxID=614101 RepID=A0ABQ9G310_9NEOP|nr:hypothetical protein PR048_032731 [Dryococelus australis]